MPIPQKKTRIRIVCIAIAIVLVICAISYNQVESYVNENKYDELIVKYAKENKLKPSLVKAVIRKETKFRRKMKGKAGERGLMQLMPVAVKDWAKNNKTSEPFGWQLYDAETNIKIGTWYLGHCCKRYKKYASHYELGLAEYNAGYKRAQKWKPANPATPLNMDKDVDIKSTRVYIRKILEYQKKYTALDKQ